MYATDPILLQPIGYRFAPVNPFYARTLTPPNLPNWRLYKIPQHREHLTAVVNLLIVVGEVSKCNGSD